MPEHSALEPSLKLSAMDYEHHRRVRYNRAVGESTTVSCAMPL